MAAATDAIEAEVPEESAGRGGGKSKLLLVGLPVLLLIGGGAGAYLAGIGPFAAGAGGVDGPPESAVPEFAPTTMVALAPFIANLAQEDGARYIKTTMQLELGGSSAPAWLEQRTPQIRDLILTLLTSKTFDEIQSPEGKQVLRDAIIRRANQALQADVVQAVYFTEFIVQ